MCVCVCTRGGERQSGSITNGADDEPEDEASYNRLLSIKQQADSITIDSLGRGGTNVRGVCVNTHTYLQTCLRKVKVIKNLQNV